MQYRFLVKIFWHTIKRSIKCHAIAMLLQWVYVLIYICSYIKCYCSTVRGDAKLSLKNPIPQYIWNMPQYHQIQYFKNNWAMLLFHVSLWLRILIAKTWLFLIDVSPSKFYPHDMCPLLLGHTFLRVKKY